MSIIKQSNIFKNNKIGSVKDYKDKYDYLNQRDEQKYNYKRNNKQRTIERTKQDKLINTENLKANIENTRNRNKLKLVKEMTNTHKLVVALFSIISGLLSSIGVANIVGVNTLSGRSIILLTIIMIYGNNSMIQPKFINSLHNKKSIEKYIGSIILGVTTLGVFYISIRTNKVTLDLVNLPSDLSIAFTFVFDLSVLGINFLHYDTCLFNVQDKVKKDLGIIEEQESKQLPIIVGQPTPTRAIGFAKGDNIKTADKVTDYLNNLQGGDPVILKDINCNYSTALKYLNEHQDNLPIEKDNTNSKYKFMKKGY